MATALKEIYTPAFIDHFSAVCEGHISGFDRQAFSKRIFASGWKNLELKARMQHVAVALHDFLPADFEKAATILSKITTELQANTSGGAIEYMFIPEYIHMYGLDHLRASCVLMEQVTQFISCEFAVRPFIIRYPEEMIAQMIKWSGHESAHVRRLASEGSRPRLPWAMALPALKKDPAPILPILENLKNDPSEMVRRSVANNLNDISRDNPALVVAIARQWQNGSDTVNALIKHACRTLLRKGHSQVLKLHGVTPSDTLTVSGLRVLEKEVRIGGALRFRFVLVNKGSRPKRVRLEYFIYLLKKSGIHTKKIFKISERVLPAGASVEVERNHSFKLITTRVFYPGLHAVSIVVNGRESDRKSFRVV